MNKSFSVVDCGKVSLYSLCRTLLLGEYISSVDNFQLNIKQCAEQIKEYCTGDFERTFSYNLDVSTRHRTNSARMECIGIS